MLSNYDDYNYLLGCYSCLIVAALILKWFVYEVIGELVRGAYQH